MFLKYLSHQMLSEDGKGGASQLRDHCVLDALLDIGQPRWSALSTMREHKLTGVCDTVTGRHDNPKGGSDSSG